MIHRSITHILTTAVLLFCTSLASTALGDVVVDTTAGTKPLPGATGDVVNYNVANTAGAWELNGPQSRSSLGQINSGALSVDFGSDPLSVLTLTGGGSDTTPGETQAALLKTGTGAFTINPNITLANNVTFAVTNTTNNITINGAIGQDVAGRTVTKTGIGTVVYGGTTTNTYTGTTTVNGGTLTLAKASGNINGQDNSAFAISGDLVINSGGTVSVLRKNQFASTGVGGSAVGSVNVTVNNGGIMTFTATGNTIAIDGYYTNPNRFASLTVGSIGSPGGQVLLNGNNTHAPRYVIGTGSGTALTMTGGEVGANGAQNKQIQFLGDVVINASATGSLLNSGGNSAHDFGGATRTFTVADGAAAVDLLFGNTSNTGVDNFENGAVIKAGEGLMAVRSGRFQTNTFTGWTIQAGTMRTDSGNVLGWNNNSGTQVTTISGGTLELNNNQSQHSRGGVILAAGRIIATTGTPTITVNSGNAWDVRSGSVEINIPGTNVRVDKTTAGTVTFTGANTYTGGTNISDGLLLVNNLSGSGTGSGAVNVTGGAIGGTGTIIAPVTIGLNGAISPGLSAGTLAVNGNLTFSGGQYLWELAALADDSSGTPGVAFDQITMSLGNFTGTGTLLPGFINDAAAPNLAVEFWQQERVWTVINNTGAGLGTGTLAVDNTPWISQGTFATATGGTGNDLLLTWTPIPEPSSAALLLTGIVLLCRSRRRRQS